MRIEVHTGNHFDDQTRAYAEYRVFVHLIAFADLVETIGIGLTRTAGSGSASPSPTFACTVCIALRDDRRVDVVSHAPHPYEAIDRAARKMANELSARAVVATLSVSGR